MAPMRVTLVLLHGFAGTGHAWGGVVDALDAERYTALAPDLRGHGSHSSAHPVTFEAVVEDVLAVAPERFALCGYSMGGRIALQTALAASERVERLVLVSTTAGIEDERARAERREADERLARAIEQEGLELFADRWLAGPLFAEDPVETQRLAREDIARNEPGGLAAALRGIGTGSMIPLWDRLAELTMPVHVVVGEHDPKFHALGERLAAAPPNARLTVIPGAGHALPRIAPRTLADTLGA